MSHIIHLKPILLLLAGVFAFAFISQTDLHKLLNIESVSEAELEYIEIYKISGHVIAGFFLILLVNIISMEKLLIFSLCSFLFSLINIAIITEYQIFKIHFLMMSGSSFGYFVLSLIKFMRYSKRNINFSLVMFFAAWILGYLCSYSANYQFEIIKLLIMNIVVVSYCLVINAFYHTLLIKTPSFYTKLSHLIKNIELQIISAFVISYVVSFIFWGYDTFSIDQNFAIEEPEQIIKYMLASIIIFIVPIAIILNTYSKYVLNLILTSILLVSFLLLPSLGVTEIGNISLMMLIGTILLLIFLCNILILYNKFDNDELITALLLYFTVSSIGSYAGRASTFGSTGDNSFLMTIGFIIGIYFIYYLIQFIRLKLYRW